MLQVILKFDQNLVSFLFQNWSKFDQNHSKDDIEFKGGFGIAFCLFYLNINLDVNLSSRNTSLPSVFEALSPTPSPMEPPPLFDIRPLPLILFRLERFQSKIQILHPTPPTTAVLQLQTSCVLNNCSSLHFARFGSLMSTIDLT